MTPARAGQGLSIRGHSKGVGTARTGMWDVRNAPLASSAGPGSDRHAAGLDMELGRQHGSSSTSRWSFSVSALVCSPIDVKES